MMKEYQLQIKIIDYLKNKKLSKLRYFHIPNQGMRSVKYNTLLSRMGMKAGCPDLILEFKGGKIVYIELKSKKGVLSISQKLWQKVSKIMNECGLVSGKNRLKIGIIIQYSPQ